MKDLMNDMSIMTDFLYPQITGMKYIMRIGEVSTNPMPHIEISNRKSRFDMDHNFAMSIEKMPRIKKGKVRVRGEDLAKVIQWIRLNYNTLMVLWEIHETGDPLQTFNGDSISIQNIMKLLKKV